MGIEHFSAAALADNSLLLVEDDRGLRNITALALRGLGFEVFEADSVQEAMLCLDQRKPAFAVVDLRLPDGSGLEVVEALRNRSSETRTVIVTGYGDIATATAAARRGVEDYLCKPVRPEAIADVLLAAVFDRPTPLPRTLNSPQRVRWEHIQKVFEEAGQNVSLTARRLSMHRRTLQRILAKTAPA